MTTFPIVVADPFALANEDVPTAQGQLRLAVEEATVRSVMAFEGEKRQVTRDHAAMQRHIWGAGEDDHQPLELPNTGA